MHDIPDKELKKRAWSGILQFFLKHGRERDLLKRWQEIADLLPEIVQMEIGYDYIETILYYTLTSINENDKITLENLLDEHLDEKKGDKIMASLAKHWYDEGREEGIEKTAINMLKQKLDDKLICQVTGLSLEQLAKLKNKL